MNITINTGILQKHNISLGEFLLMLIGYFDIDFTSCHDSIIKKLLAEPDVFKETNIVLPNNSKDLVAQILLESNEKAIQSNIDFESLAAKLMTIYPSGNKPGTTYKWRGTVKVIAQKLRALVVLYDFNFTPKEAITSVKEYISAFNPPYENMLLLKSFILNTKKSFNENTKEVSSLFMTYIENNID